MFAVRASRLKILQDPVVFHRKLVRACGEATRRVSLSALYVGTGAPEAEMVAALREACRTSPRLIVRVVLDGARARRREGSSVLGVLAREFPDRVRVTTWDALPRRAAWLARIPFIGEILGVFHVKIFAIDDQTVISGANLSTTYFTNRLDRYLVVRDKTVARWHHDLVDLLAETSLRDLPERLAEHCRIRSQEKKKSDAWIFPAPQLGDLVDGERRALDALVDRADAHPRTARLNIATAYLNPPRDAIDRLVASRARVSVLAPSIASHGFANARDIRKNIPKAYQLIARDLAAAIGRSALREWHDDRRTFHAKGAWLFVEKNKPRFAATLLGSSNMNVRARTRDLELSYLLFTANRRLRRALAAEWRAYLSRAAPPRTLLAKPEGVPIWVTLLRPWINTFL
ncbi:hypothetical protein CTAYLR_002648 [Chrysophaeum taylorii]|uniref:CDP-diacylglycerol--glycerol-3-phosphate 3-phosphatidyltransferase n=1 Tax=Chrysophaeum taylorii TaxID=2483200 RepID=A0AAD7XHP4_9STRA|nr:hypothetical protein CTAYLR_002648 [Chrysophaeum taylorii]